MVRIITSIVKAAQARFRPEELFFGISAVGTVIIDYGSVVPALFTMCLLAFYYLFFGWFMMSVPSERHLFFSIISGVVYSISLLTMVFIIVTNDSLDGFFYVTQLVLLAPVFGYLVKKDWGIYKSNHYIRIGIILFLNIYVLLFK